MTPPQPGDEGLARRQSALLHLSTSIAAAHTEKEVCESLVQGLHDDALGYNMVGVLLVEPETGDRVLQASVGWPGAEEGLRLRPGEGLSERPLLDGELHYAPRVVAEDHWIQARRQGSEIDVPIKVDEEVIGVLVVESDEEDAFGRADFEILTAAAQQSGIAMGRTRLLRTEQQRANEQQALLDTMKDLSGELELNKLLQRVTERAVSLLGVTGGELAIAEEDTGELVIVASHNIGSDSTGTRMAIGEGAMGRVAETHEPLIIPNYQDWEGRSNKYEDTTAMGVMVVPLLIGQRLVGTLASVHNEADRTFGPSDIRLLNLFAPQAAVAIENARLFTEAFRQHEFFETVVTESPVAIVTLDLEGRITSFNPAFERLFGYAPEEAVGKDLDNLLNTPETLREARAYTEEASSGTVTRGIGKRRRKDGTFVDVEFTADSVQVTGEAVAILALYHDVTELLEARHAAEEANQAKSQFLANMSHELRTPLNAIIGYSEMLQEEAEDEGHEELVPDLGKIHSAGRHLLALINDILDLSKIEAGKTELFLESFDLEELVRGVESTVAPLVARNQNQLSVVLDEDIGTLVADVTKVQQVLLNLLSNAAKFTENGQIELRVGVEGDQVFMDVSDEGIGMSPEQLERIFEAFGQADASTQRRYGGTGLGLVISREFCRMMGGDIQVLSAPGHGTTFTVRLPRLVRDPAAEATQRTASHSPGATGTGEAGTVLVIDDDPNVHDLLRRTLSKRNFRVESALHGAEGLEQARGLEPDVILLDVLMPGMDGWTVLAALKAEEELATIPVVMVTMVDEQNLGFSLGANDYLTKPVEPARLSAVLRRLCPQADATILIVEDDPAVRDRLSHMVAEGGWRPVLAENGREALDLQNDLDPHLIVLDLIMPEMDGFQFLTALREHGRWQDVPVVVITAKELTQADRDQLNGSVARVFMKDEVGAEVLVAELRRFLDRKPVADG